ncbi:SRPBCC family protein [Barrientosiimonas humi]|uniref:SRPBCC family protein n=1 Tax=Barrientosiimonas humi TaxID=999931 RepID=UPI00114EE230|nr:SRPBCC family protein [Barrientosiimonas humi]
MVAVRHRMEGIMTSLFGRVTSGPGVRIRNVHSRIARGGLADAERLIELLGGDDDALWPSDRWQPLLLDRGAVVGSRGGHGLVRYTVSAREPGLIEFTFDKGTGLVGSHRLSVEQLSGGRLLWMHELDGRSIMPRAATEAVVVLHDALIEDLLDAAEALGAGESLHRRRFGPAVAALHRLDRWFDRTPRAVASA